METFIIKLVVAILPLITLIAVVLLPDHRCWRRAQAVCGGRRTRTAMARGLAAGIMFR